MTIKHTRGPWRTGDMFHTVFGPPNGTPSPETIATVFRGNRANARLIASAPEMYDLLRSCEVQVMPSNEDGCLELWQKIRAVLKKVHGES